MKSYLKMEFLFTESQASQYCGFENLRMAALLVRNGLS